MMRACFWLAAAVIQMANLRSTRPNICLLHINLVKRYAKTEFSPTQQYVNRLTFLSVANQNLCGFLKKYLTNQKHCDITLYVQWEDAGFQYTDVAELADALASCSVTTVSLFEVPFRDFFCNYRISSVKWNGIF